MKKAAILAVFLVFVICGIGVSGYFAVNGLTHPAIIATRFLGAPMTGFASGIFDAVACLVCGFATLIAIRHLLDRTRQIVFDQSGIKDAITPFGFIPWSEVRSLQVGPLNELLGGPVRSTNSFRSLKIDVADPEKYLTRLPRWKRLMTRGVNVVVINFMEIKPGLGEVVEFLRQLPATTSVPIEES